MGRALKISIAVLILLLLYVGTFSVWWLRSPNQTVGTYNGTWVHIVELRFNKFHWHTKFIWIPALLFMDKVCGYKQQAVAPMYDGTIVFYAKPVEKSSKPAQR